MLQGRSIGLDGVAASGAWARGRAGQMRWLPQPCRGVFGAMAMSVVACVHTILIEQHHGDAVVVPIGWIHCVTNVQLCFKIAFDRVMPGDCAKVASPGH